MKCDHIHALKLVKAGDWNEAHKLVQDHSDKFSCLIHGYLHRVEGDFSNANYWYNRADEAMPNNSLEEEIVRIYDIVSQ